MSKKTKNEQTNPLVEESALETPPEAQEGDHQYDARFLSRTVEGALLAAGEALSLTKLLTLFDENKRPSKKQLTETLMSISENLEDRGFVLKEVASGWRFEVCDDLAPWVNRLWDEKPQKYSRALLETLALIAYRQPLTRGDIEDVRGVAVSSHIIKTLTERDWVKVIGHRDVPGRPALYATTRQLLDYFGLKSLEDLPSLGELKDIESLSAALDLKDKEASPRVTPDAGQAGAVGNEQRIDQGAALFDEPARDQAEPGPGELEAEELVASKVAEATDDELGSTELQEELYSAPEQGAPEQAMPVNAELIDVKE